MAKTLHSSLFAAAALITFTAPSSHATLDSARESLIERSPFVQWEAPRMAPKPQPAPVVQTGRLSNEIQFNGVLKIGDENYFNIFDKIENKSILLGLDDGRGGRFKVVGYDASGDRTLTVEAFGRQEQISMATSDGVSIPTQMAQPANNTNTLRAAVNKSTPTVRPTRTSSAEGRRRRVIPRRITTTEGD